MPYPKRTVAERAAKFSSVDPVTGCWVWHGSFGGRYGKMAVREGGELVMRAAHRAVYESLVGPVPDGLELDHLCRNTACINPEHLEPVTHRENMARGTSPAAVNVAKTQCVHGHELAGSNLYVTPDGRRQCRACRNEATARYARGK